MKLRQPLGQSSRVGFFAAALTASLIAAMLVSVAEATLYELPWTVVIGLYAPASVAIIAALLLVSRLLTGAHLPEIGTLLQYRARRFRIILGSFFIPVTLVLLGRLALGFFGELEERPVVAGVLLASSTVGIFTFISWIIEKSARALCARFAGPDLRTTILIGTSVFLLLLGTLLYIGDTGGVAHSLSLFGVFKREELNLVPLLSILSLFALSFLALAMVRKKPRVGLGAGSLLLAFFVYCAFQAALIDFQESLAFERSMAMSGISLTYHQLAFDKDRDGFSPYYGGEDCNDTDSSIFPGAVEIKNDGIDQDCQAGDLKELKQTSAKPVVKVAAPITLKKNLNVLLLTIDTLRFDLGFSGEPNSSKTPFMDKLAESSTVFERSYSLASYTSKSLGPMMLGRYPSETFRSFEHFDRFRKNVPFLAERIAKADIQTLSVQGYWYFYLKGYGFERGFDTLNHKAAPRVISIEGDNSFNGDRVADELLKELAKIKNERFFAWAHWVDPHAQYVRHKEFDFGDSPKQRYDSEVAFVDAQVGKIVDYLRLEKLLESTVLIITSDHGEAFGEHGMKRHGFELWEELVRVPLIVRLPGASQKRVSERRSLIDIVPTILEVLDIPATGNESSLRGTSLISDILGKDSPKRPILVDMPKGPHNQERQAYIEDDLKLITSAGRVIGLYDLKADVEERVNLKADKSKISEINAKKSSFTSRLKPVAAR